MENYKVGSMRGATAFDSNNKLTAKLVLIENELNNILEKRPSKAN